MASKPIPPDESEANPRTQEALRCTFGDSRPWVSVHRRENWPKEVKMLYEQLKRGLLRQEQPGNTGPVIEPRDADGKMFPKYMEAVAELLKWDQEFFWDDLVSKEIKKLLLDPDLRDTFCNRELGKIANSLRRRRPKNPGHRPMVIGLDRLIRRQRLMSCKLDLEELRSRVNRALWNGWVHAVVSDKPLSSAESLRQLQDELQRPPEITDFKKDRKGNWKRVRPVAPAEHSGTANALEIADALHRAMVKSISEPSAHGIRESLSWAKNTVADAYGIDMKTLHTRLGREPSPARRKARRSS